MWTGMAEWIRTEERQQQAAAPETAPLAAKGKSVAETISEKVAASRDRQAQRQRAKAGVRGGQNHVPPPPTRIERREADVPPVSAKQGDDPRGAEEEDDAGPPRPQRDGMLYDMNNYLQEVIAQRQLRISGLRDARKIGKLEVDGFNEVWTPCVGKVPEETGGALGNRTNATDAAEEADGAGSEERKDSEEPAIRGRAPASPSDTPEPVEAAVGICDDPDEHLFYTGFTVSQRAVAAIARQAGDMVRKNETLRARWARMKHPPVKLAGG